MSRWINKIGEQYNDLEPGTWCYSPVVFKSRFDLGGRSADKELRIKTAVKFNHAWNNKRTITQSKKVSFFLRRFCSRIMTWSYIIQSKVKKFGIRSTHIIYFVRALYLCIYSCFSYCEFSTGILFSTLFIIEEFLFYSLFMKILLYEFILLIYYDRKIRIAFLVYLLS